MVIELLKDVGNIALGGLGLPRWVHRHFLPDRLAILMYHAIPPEPLPVAEWCCVPAGEFRQQMEYLARNFDVLPLLEAVARLRANRVNEVRPRRPMAVLTFDDGYQNNHVVAWPILRALGLPATVFVSTGLIGTANTIWFGRLHEALTRTGLGGLDWAGRHYDLTGAPARTAASHQLQEHLKDLPHERLLAESRRLILELGDDPDREIEPESPFRMLDRASAAALAGSGLIELGAHTRSHAILSRLEPGAAREEIASSVEAVAELTGRPCRSFAYPNGRRQDYDPVSQLTLEALGIEAAVTTIEGPNEAATPPLELRRYGIGAGMPLVTFQMTVHHATSELRRLLGREREPAEIDQMAA